MIWIKDAKYKKEFKVTLWFSDGTSYDVDLQDALSGPVFEALKDISLFSKVKYSSDLETVYWDSGADFAPEYLYDLAREQNMKNVSPGQSK